MFNRTKHLPNRTLICEVFLHLNSCKGKNMRKKLAINMSKDIQADKNVKDSENTSLLKGILTGAIVGGLLGSLAGLWGPGLSFELTNSSVVANLAKTALGVIIGTCIGGLFSFQPTKSNSPVSQETLNNAGDKATLQLREEQLDITKRWVQTGDVTMHKEILTEEKNIVVPIAREELVIEKQVFAKGQPYGHTETIRIPVSEERIKVIKQPVILEEISAYKRQFQEIESVEETVKKEKVHLDINGDL